MSGIIDQLTDDVKEQFKNTHPRISDELVDESIQQLNEMLNANRLEGIDVKTTIKILTTATPDPSVVQQMSMSQHDIRIEMLRIADLITSLHYNRVLNGDIKTMKEAIKKLETIKKMETQHLRFQAAVGVVIFGMYLAWAFLKQ